MNRKRFSILLLTLLCLMAPATLGQDKPAKARCS